MLKVRKRGSSPPYRHQSSFLDPRNTDGDLRCRLLPSAVVHCYIPFLRLLYLTNFLIFLPIYRILLVLTSFSCSSSFIPPLLFVLLYLFLFALLVPLLAPSSSWNASFLLQSTVRRWFLWCDLMHFGTCLLGYTASCHKIVFSSSLCCFPTFSIFPPPLVRTCLSFSHFCIFCSGNVILPFALSALPSF